VLLESEQTKFRISSIPTDRLRQGWVFLERTRIRGGIQFTTHFVDFFVVETKLFVSSTVNVILTRQTCGQRSSRAGESKRRALEKYFSERICHMFPISKSRGGWDLGRCTFLVLAKREPLHNGDFRKKRFAPAGKNGIRYCAAVLFLQVPKKCTNLDLSLLYILILRTCGKYAQKNIFLALGVCFPQPCSSAGCRFAASKSRLQYYRRIVSFPQPKIRWNAL